MPSKRAPLNRDYRRPVDPESALEFRRLCELEPTWRNCIRSAGCHRPREGELCAECSEFHGIFRRLAERYSIEPFQSFWRLVTHDRPPVLLNERGQVQWWIGALERALADCRAPGLKPEFMR